MKNEEHIKKKIVEYRDRGVCDRNGNTIPKEKRSAGKGDRNRSVALLFMDRPAFESKIIKTWPRDKDGNLIED